VSKVPVKVEIGGNLVEDWCRIGEKGKGRHVPTFSDLTPDKKRGVMGWG